LREKRLDQFGHFQGFGDGAQLVLNSQNECNLPSGAAQKGDAFQRIRHLKGPALHVGDGAGVSRNRGLLFFLAGPIDSEKNYDESGTEKQPENSFGGHVFVFIENNRAIQKIISDIPCRPALLQI
jgi:hypothetical protein